MGAQGSGVGVGVGAGVLVWEPVRRRNRLKSIDNGHLALKHWSYEWLKYGLLGPRQIHSRARNDALEFAAMVPALTKAARPALRDQLERASSSIALTLAEGNARRTRRDRHHFFSMAQGSALECTAAIDILRVTGRVNPTDATRARHELTRIVQMLVGLRRCR